VPFGRLAAHSAPGEIRELPAFRTVVRRSLPVEGDNYNEFLDVPEALPDFSTPVVGAMVLIGIIGLILDGIMGVTMPEHSVGPQAF
jgi:hypothetical protein